MNSLVKNGYRILLGFTAAICLITVSCSDMNEKSDEFLSKGSTVYAPKVDSVAAHSGFKKIELEVFIKTQKIDVVKITWNNGQNEEEISVKNQPGVYKKVIEDVAEDNYVFYLVSLDSYGNKSLPFEVSGSAYGDQFKNQFKNRLITKTVRAGNLIRISWGVADISKDPLYTEVVYTASDETEKIIQVPVSETTTEIPDLESGTSFKYRTAYSLNVSDVITTDYKEFNDDLFFEKTGWSILGFSSEFDAGVNAAANAINGKYGDRWHTWVDYPHFMTIDFGVEVTVTRFDVWPTTYAMAANTIDDRFPIKVKFEVSLDNVSWTNLGEFDCNNQATILGARVFNVTPTPARYYKFTGIESTPGNPLMVIDEFDVYCK
jgi:hypothetical protein